MRSDYKICPICGAILDIGEQCDCGESKNQGEYKHPQEIRAQGSRYAPGITAPRKEPRHTKAQQIAIK